MCLRKRISRLAYLPVKRLNPIKYFLLIFIAGAFSCSKSKTSEPTSSFKFTVNGAYKEWFGPGNGTTICALCGPALAKYPGYFVLGASSAQDYGEAIIFQINTTAITIASYSDTIKSIVDPPQFAAHRINIKAPLILAGATEPGDFASITVTSIKEGKYYDGTFRARFTSYPYGNTAPKVNVEGEFSNVQMH